MKTRYDLVIIGAGPGGYEAAAYAAGRGMKTALIEKSKLGGTCLNHGCIPTKTLMHSAEIYRSFQSCEAAGVFAENTSYDMEKTQQHKEDVIEQLRKGIETMLLKSKVDIYCDEGRITGKDTVELKDGTELCADNILICTGSISSMPPIKGIELPGVVDSEQLLDSREVCERLLIIGGGVIGMEFAYIYNSLGTEVTVVEALDKLLANMDREISQSIKMTASKRGIDIHTSAAVQEITKNEDGSLKCIFSQKDELKEAAADMILVAAGRRSNIDGLIGDGVDIATENGRIVTDENGMTSVQGIYAAGDVTGGVMLAHVATAEAVNAVCHMNGEKPAYDMGTIPSCVYTQPEIASAGMTADEAKKQGIKTATAKYPMSANGKSLLSNQERGFVKVVADADTGKLIGAQMMCARATDMIAVFAEGIVNGLTAEQMASAIYPHPTFGEGMGEALKLLTGKLKKG